MPKKPRSRTVATRTVPMLVARAHNLPTNRPPTHPGEMLLEEFLKPRGITQSAFAIRLGVSFPRLNEIINGKRSVTVETALRLARVTGMSAEFWLDLQQGWDLWHALSSNDARRIEKLRPLSDGLGRKAQIASRARRA